MKYNLYINCNNISIWHIKCLCGNSIKHSRFFIRFARVDSMNDFFFFLYLINLFFLSSKLFLFIYVFFEYSKHSKKTNNYFQHLPPKKLHHPNLFPSYSLATFSSWKRYRMSITRKNRQDHSYLASPPSKTDLISWKHSDNGLESNFHVCFSQVFCESYRFN